MKKAAEDLKAQAKIMQYATTKEIFRIHPPSSTNSNVQQHASSIQ
jgi:hypothetical protein